MMIAADDKPAAKADWQDFVSPVVALLTTLTFLVLTYQLKETTRTVPLLVIYANLVFVLLDFVVRTDTGAGRALKPLISPGSKPTQIFGPGRNVPREFGAVAWVLCFSGATILFGVLASIPVFVVAYMVLWARYPMVKALICSAAISATIWLLFEKLLRCELYRGMLFQ